MFKRLSVKLLARKPSKFNTEGVMTSSSTEQTFFLIAFLCWNTQIVEQLMLSLLINPPKLNWVAS